MMKFAAPLLLPLALLALPVGAQEAAFPDFEIAEEAVKRGEILPLATILDELAALQPGRVIEVELDVDDGIQIYEVELISPDGRLLEVELDAKTGTILYLDEEN